MKLTQEVLQNVKQVFNTRNLSETVIISIFEHIKQIKRWT